MIRLLVVCLGNICRSPLAHAILHAHILEKHLDDRVGVDSCGTSAAHEGEPADRDMAAVASDRGLDLSFHRARQLTEADFYEFDAIVVMDRQNERDVGAQRPENSTARIARWMDFVPGATTQDVPDPWSGGRAEFEEVQDLLLAGADHVIGWALTPPT